MEINSAKTADRQQAPQQTEQQIKPNFGETMQERMQETLLLVSSIRKDARVSLSKLSRQAGMPISTIYERLKRFEGSIIKKYTATIDFAGIGYNAHACVLVKIEPGERLKFQEYMLNCSHLNSFFKINNGFDFYMEFVFRNLREFEEYIDTIECRFRILEKHTFYIVNDLKREQFLSNPNTVIIKGRA